jgi:hypothetical protein
VTDHRAHRGASPEDSQLFAAAQLARMRAAVAELSWLLTRGYAEASALKLVGDRHQLGRRQISAVQRCSCSDQQLSKRSARRVADVRGHGLAIDGYNVLTTVETALGGGVVIVGRDGCARDIAGVHGTWRRVAETEPALRAVGERLQQLGVGHCLWFLDRPVSNSGRLRAYVLDMAKQHGWRWDVEVVMNPDAELGRSDAVVASADSEVLDNCRAWFELAGTVVAGCPGAWVVDLREAGGGCGSE